jgi:hypothetical protein
MGSAALRVKDTERPLYRKGREVPKMKPFFGREGNVPRFEQRQHRRILHSLRNSRRDDPTPTLRVPDLFPTMAGMHLPGIGRGRGLQLATTYRHLSLHLP